MDKSRVSAAAVRRLDRCPALSHMSDAYATPSRRS
jgi:hypothetical protein